MSALPPPSLRQLERRRRRARRRRRLSFILGLLAIAAAAAFVLRAPFFEVGAITVTGLDRLNEAEVVTAAGIPPGSNVWTLSMRGLEERLRGLPRVAEVQARREWPNLVRITIAERTGLLAMACGTGWLEIAGDGVAIAIWLSERPIGSDGQPLPELLGFEAEQVALGQAVPGAAGRATVSAAAVILTAGEPVQSVVVSAAGIEVMLPDGTALRLGTAASDLDQKAAAAVQLLHQLQAAGIAVEYVDVRLPAHPVYKPR